MKYKIIAIDAVINIGAKVVKKMLALRGTRNTINEKHAGHTPTIKPIRVPAIPDFLALFVLHSMQLFLEFRDALQRVKGISIFTFTDPVVALEHFTINKAQYVFVISDLRMPGLDGIELIKKIKDVHLFARTILMTVFEIDDKLFQQYSKKDIINGFLQKLIRLDDLFLEVNNQLHTYIRITKK